MGTTRRRWGRRGVKIIQRVQRRYEWMYLALVVDGLGGMVRWTWQRTMKSVDLVPSLATLRAQGPLDGIIWDGAPAHHAKAVADLGLPCLFLPPYSPELNPAERIFEEIRRWVEGEVYATLADKQAAVERYLQALAADPDRVRSLAGWPATYYDTEHAPSRSMS